MFCTSRSKLLNSIYHEHHGLVLVDVHDDVGVKESLEPIPGLLDHFPLPVLENLTERYKNTNQNMPDILEYISDNQDYC